MKPMSIALMCFEQLYYHKMCNWERSVENQSDCDLILLVKIQRYDTTALMYFDRNQGFNCNCKKLEFVYTNVVGFTQLQLYFY